MPASRDRSLLFPPFEKVLSEFERRLAVRGLPFSLFMAMRTFRDQEDLYAQGRTQPGKIVTNAKGGDSWHNYCLAADYVADGMPEKPGVQWSWDMRLDLDRGGRSDWYEMGEIAEACGLEWGGRWKSFPDFPHVQKRYGLTLAEAKELYRVGGLKQVWAQCHEERIFARA